MSGFHEYLREKWQYYAGELYCVVKGETWELKIADSIIDWIA